MLKLGRCREAESACESGKAMREGRCEHNDEKKNKQTAVCVTVDEATTTCNTPRHTHPSTTSSTSSPRSYRDIVPSEGAEPGMKRAPVMLKSRRCSEVETASMVPRLTRSSFSVSGSPHAHAWSDAIRKGRTPRTGQGTRDVQLSERWALG
eukprot:2836785-Rhodomonas_salina.2